MGQDGGAADEGWCAGVDPMLWARGVDTEKPSVARVYDYWLGGSHNFTADREAARRLIELMPSAPAIAQANRAFLHRAVRALAAEGVDQFLDIGSGIPTLGNVHDVAARVNPRSRVVYVDIDPVAVTHSRQILDGNDRAAVLMADLRVPETILDSPEVAGTLDLTRPVGLLLVAVLHFVPDADDPEGAVARLRDALAPGSHLVISHAAPEGFDEATLSRVREVYRGTPAGRGGVRDRDRIRGFFGDFALIPPGLVWLTEWRPEHPEDVGSGPLPRPQSAGVLAGVGRKE